MTTCLASLLLAGSFVQVAPPITVEKAALPTVSIAAVVKLPALGEKDRELLDVLMRVLPKGTEDFSRATLMQVTDGRTIRCKLLPDCVLISFTVPKGAAKSGISILNALLRNAALLQEDLDSALEQRRRMLPGYWNAEFYPQSFELQSASRDSAEDVYHRVFTPEHTQVACLGPVKAEDIEGYWAAKTLDWKDLPVADYPDQSVPDLLTSNPGHVTTVSFIGQEFAGNDPSLPTRLLALYALGAGKGSSLFRRSRETHGWSYRQESTLWGVAAGWQGRLFVAMDPKENTAARIEVLKQELLTDVQSWTEGDRARAIGMAEANLERGVPYGPLVVGDEPISSDPETQARMTAYWAMKTGSVWDPAKLQKSMGFVTLTDLKVSASELLTGASVHMLKGAGL